MDTPILRLEENRDFLSIEDIYLKYMVLRYDFIHPHTEFIIKDLSYVTDILGRYREFSFIDYDRLLTKFFVFDPETTVEDIRTFYSREIGINRDYADDPLIEFLFDQDTFDGFASTGVIPGQNNEKKFLLFKFVYDFKARTEIVETSDLTLFPYSNEDLIDMLNKNTEYGGPRLFEYILVSELSPYRDNTSKYKLLNSVFQGPRAQ